MCIFCSIVKGEIPSEKVYEDELVMGFKDVNPVAPLHLLFIPKKHVVNVFDASEEPGLMEALFTAIRQYRDQEGLDADGVRIVTNAGESAGQSVFHFHVHVLSGRRLHWPPG